MCAACSPRTIAQKTHGFSFRAGGTASMLPSLASSSNWCSNRRMRWQHLALDESGPPPGLPAPLFTQGAVVRRFDTPHFRGITFFEVRARSIINKVPEASRVPFRWTINPYRGCSHACSYCLSGDTHVLMADGRSKPISEIRVGDTIVG